MVCAVLHDLNQAALADQVLMLRGGRVLKAGPVAEVLRADTVRSCFGVEVEALRRAGGRHHKLSLACLVQHDDLLRHGQVVGIEQQ